MIARYAAMRHTRQRALAFLVLPAATTGCITAPSAISRAFISFREQQNVASGKTATATAPVGARAAHIQHQSLRGCSRGGPTVGVSGCATDVPLETGSRRALSSALLASDDDNISVVQDGTENFLVAQRKLVAGDVLFGCTPGTQSAVRSRHSIQITPDLHLTVSDGLQLINHGCTPNCQLELVEASSTTDKVRTVHPQACPMECCCRGFLLLFFFVRDSRCVGTPD